MIDEPSGQNSGEHDLGAIKVMHSKGPLGEVRLRLRVIGQAEGYVFCRHGRHEPFPLAIADWSRLPIAGGDNFDL